MLKEFSTAELNFKLRNLTDTTTYSIFVCKAKKLANFQN